MNQESRLAWTNHFLKMHSLYWKKNSKFWKEIDISDQIDDIPDIEYDQYLDLRAEDEGILTEWICEITHEFGEISADKLVKIRKVYLGLETTDKVLYDMYFTNEMSMRDISNKLNIPLSTVFGMITRLKNNIKVCVGN